MKKALLLTLFLAGCSATKPPVVHPPMPRALNPNHLPADILKLHPKSYPLGSLPNVCDNLVNKCKAGVDGYMHESEINQQCYCIPMKCSPNAGKETCIDLIPRTL